MIGCKHQVYEWASYGYSRIEVDAPGIDWFSIYDVDWIEFEYVIEDGSQDKWDLETNENRTIISTIWSCLSLISHRNSARINLSSRTSLRLELSFHSSTGLDCYVALSVLGDGIDINLITDPDLVASARCLLMEQCPEDVFLDLLCEKCESINKLRYAV